MMAEAYGADAHLVATIMAKAKIRRPTHASLNTRYNNDDIHCRFALIPRLQTAPLSRRNKHLP